MNKTVSINLGGFFFHIDEDAYQKLTRYINAVKRSLDPEGRDEIVSDIESRIAELFQERIKNEKQVIGLVEVDQVISIMGQPEDYIIDEDTEPKQSYSYSSTKNSGRAKRLYRDGENSILGGVAAGFGHYLNIDPLWIRILFIVSPFISFGTSIVIYLILWILIPEATTTSQKLEMRGEPINISNIEKKVKEGINEISEKINNIDGQKVANTARSGANQIATTVGDIFLGILKVFAKVIGVLITIFASIALISIIISAIALIFSSSMPDMFIFNHVHTPLNFSLPLWAQGILLILSVGIPLLFLLILGLNLLVTNIKPISNYIKISLFAFWIISVLTIAFFGFRELTENSFDGKNIEKIEIAATKTDTLFVKMAYNNYHSKNLDRRTSKKYTIDENGNEIIYSNNVRFYLMETDGNMPYMEVEKSAYGNSFQHAKDNAEKINYHFEINENRITLDNYFVTDIANKYRDQEIKVYLYIPEGMSLKPDSSLRNYDRSNNNFFNLHYSSDQYVYQLQDAKMMCLNCPKNEDEYDDIIDNDTLNENISLKFNDKEINIKVEENKVNIQTK